MSAHISSPLSLLLKKRKCSPASSLSLWAETPAQLKVAAERGENQPGLCFLPQPQVTLTCGLTTAL